MVWFVLVPLIQCGGSCAYEAHVTFENVDELREFILGLFSDELADSGLFCAIRKYFIAYDSWVEIHFEHHSVTDFVLGHEFFFRASASMYMLRNLYILNFLPFLPIRSCEKKIGPGEFM